MNTITFDEWWENEGKYLDPDTEDVSWFDKRKELAQMAFGAGRAGSGNYVADHDTYPKEVRFANGRVVQAAENRNGPYLIVNPLPERELERP